jgi:hypothetical protein
MPLTIRRDMGASGASTLGWAQDQEQAALVARLVLQRPERRWLRQRDVRPGPHGAPGDEDPTRCWPCGGRGVLDPPLSLGRGASGPDPPDNVAGKRGVGGDRGSASLLRGPAATAAFWAKGRPIRPADGRHGVGVADVTPHRRPHPWPAARLCRRRLRSCARTPKIIFFWLTALADSSSPAHLLMNNPSGTTPWDDLDSVFAFQRVGDRVRLHRDDLH